MLNKGVGLKSARPNAPHVRLIRAGLAGALLVVGACNPFDSTVCTTIAVAAVRVTIRDAAAKRPLPVASSVVLVDGGYRDSVSVSPSNGGTPVVVGLGFGRPGTYSITVRAAGYSDWFRSGIVVSGDRCGHPNTVEFAADLQPNGRT